MIVLVLNAGSATLKYQLIDTATERVLARGLVERIGHEVPDHGEAVRIALSRLDARDIEAVGHRMVHGGDTFSTPVVIDAEVEARIEECAALAPLHNPINLRAYRAAHALLPELKHVAVFDTAFHQTVPEHAYTYGLPWELCARQKVRRYGFHGTSHRYVAERFRELHGRAGKLITCHLGNGCSMCAIERGRCVDTSMGLTPLEGLLMGTRTGDVDAGAVLHLMRCDSLGVAEMDALLNQRSGLLGISGLSNDMRTLLAHSGDARGRLAVDVFCYRIRKYIGAYFAVLDGADAVVFTAGIGENSPLIRARSCERLEAFGIRVDAARNEAAVGVEADISADGASTRVWVIPTNEELLIARDTERTVR